MVNIVHKRMLFTCLMSTMMWLQVYAVAPDLTEMAKLNISRDAFVTLLNQDLKGILKSLEKLYNSVEDNRDLFDDIGFDCLNDTERIIVDLTKNEPYALRFIDADAKIPPGVLQGQLYWPGDYHECISIHSPYNPHTGHSFVGTYYTASIGRFYIGLCVPDSCDKDDAKSLVSAIFTNEKITHVFSSDRINANEGTIVGFVICGLIAVIVVVCTFVDYFFLSTNIAENSHTNGAVVNRYNVSTQEPTERTGLLVDALLDIEPPGPSKIRRVIQAFSFFGNSKKLLNTRTATGPLSCLNGIRVVSMFWVIQGHTYGYLTIVLKDPFYTQILEKRLSFQAIANGTYSVDSFFFLSGLLVSYLALKELSEKGRLSWIYYFLHRYWRLTPVYAFCLMFFMTLYKLMLTGPFAWIGLDPAGQLYGNTGECQKYWWSNLLYINNLYPHYGSRCMDWTWYLANDMQMYVLLGPVMIIFLYKRPKIGIGLGIFLIASCVACRAVIANYFQMNQFGQVTAHKNAKWAHGGPLYSKPYARWSVYIIGMLVGYVLQITRCSIRMPRPIVVFGWSVATAIAMTVIWGLYYYNSHKDSEMSEAGSLMYLACARTGWGVSLAWLTLASATGHGGWVNRILAWKYWAPLGRLTYAAYLVHPMVLTSFELTIVQPIPFTDMIFVHLFIGILVLSYGIAFVVSMIIEAPMMQLEKIILNKS